MLPSINLNPKSVTSVYPESLKSWHERDELVQGGCNANGTKEDIGCYDNWNAAMISKVLDNPSANLIVLVSVGAGVLELKSLISIIQLRAFTGGVPINRVWLIDPEQDEETGNQVASNVAAYLEDVEVTYFTGDDAYVKAGAEHTRIGAVDRVETAVVGGLNLSFGIITTHPSFFVKHEQTLTFFRQLRNERNRHTKLFFVSAFYGFDRRHSNTTETVDEFLLRRQKKVENSIAELRRCGM